MPFETFTFVHIRALTPPTPSLYLIPPPPPNKKKCQIRILCQFIEKYPPLKKWILCQKNFTYHTPPPSRPDHTHLPHNTPPIFFLIWIICQLDSVLVIFWQIDEESKLKKKSFFFFLGGGGGGGGGGRGGGGQGCGGRCLHNVQMFKMTLLLFKEYKCAKLF